MRELNRLLVEIRPMHYTDSKGREFNQLVISADYNGKHFEDREMLWQSDAVSVVDLCFERAKRCITDMIKRDEADHA